MKRFFLCLFISFMVFSCKSKKTVVTKKEKPTTTTKEVVVKDNNPIPDPNKPNPKKVYKSDAEEYIDTYKAIAQNEMKLYEIPASIILAQGILESGSGTGRLVVEANNHFGIKCHDWTGDKIYHDDDKKQECFRKYKAAKYSFRDHSLFLAQRDRYLKLFQLKEGDYKGWAKGLRAAGYATDRRYPQKLIGIIELYELYKLDEEVSGKNYVQDESFISEEEVSEKVVVEENNVREVIPVSSAKEVHKVLKGDTLYSISKKYNTTVEELQELNNLSGTGISLGQVLVVKPYYNNQAVYKVEKGDTLYSISKKHNITVKRLQMLNNLNDTTLSVGQVLVVK